MSGDEIGDSVVVSLELVVGAHVALGKARLKSALVEVGQHFHSLGVDLIEELVCDCGLSGVDPKLDGVELSVAHVVNGVGLVIGVKDVEVRLGDLGSEEGDVASGSVGALGLGVNANSGGPDAEDLGLERVVDLEVLHVGRLGVVGEVSVLGGGALVGGGLLGVIDVLLLVPGTSELRDIKVLEGNDGVADDGVKVSREHHFD